MSKGISQSQQLDTTGFGRDQQDLPDLADFGSPREANHIDLRTWFPEEVRNDSDGNPRKLELELGTGNDPNDAIVLRQDDKDMLTVSDRKVGIAGAISGAIEAPRSPAEVREIERLKAARQERRCFIDGEGSVGMRLRDGI